MGKALDGYNFGDTFAFFVDVDEEYTHPLL